MYIWIYFRTCYPFTLINLSIPMFEACYLTAALSLLPHRTISFYFLQYCHEAVCLCNQMTFTVNYNKIFLTTYENFIRVWYIDIVRFFVAFIKVLHFHLAVELNGEHKFTPRYFIIFNCCIEWILFFFCYFIICDWLYLKHHRNWCFIWYNAKSNLSFTFDIFLLIILSFISLSGHVFWKSW